MSTGTTPGSGMDAAQGGVGEPPVAVRVEGVDKVFTTRAGTVSALEGIDLVIGAGEFVSLLGPSGCGKSTLLRLVADLDSPTTGRVEVFGRTPSAAREAGEYGIAFQSAGLLPWRTVRGNVELPLELHGVSRRERAARAAELLALVGLHDFTGHFPHQLSGGMQQRVAIARALAEQPRLLLMDEPFGALDEMTRERMQDELVRIAGASQAAVLFVTHSIAEAVFLSDRVVVMSPRPGRVAAVVPVRIPGEQRTEGLREDAAFFASVTTVREALHRGGGPTPGTPAAEAAAAVEGDADTPGGPASPGDDPGTGRITRAAGLESR